MVSRTDPLAARIGCLMLWGAFSGVGIAFFSVAWLVLAGRPLTPWPLALDGGWLELLAGAGLLLLAGTPVVALAVLGAHTARVGRRRSLAVTLGLGLVLTGGVLLAVWGA